MEYLFILGRATQLCLAELKAILKSKNIEYQEIFSSAEIFHIKTLDSLDSQLMIRLLGGTIKIAEILDKTEYGNDDKLIPKITDSITKKSNGKIIFGLSAHGGIRSIDLNQWIKKVKEKLEENGCKTRFVLPKEGTILSSVVITQQKVQEIILSKENEQIILAKTLAVQDFEDWGKRDFGRPEVNPHAGMLPPKVARMMINLASQEDVLQNLQKPIVLDPFCGVGTILAEGLMLGLKVIGSDISQKAVENTIKNLEWLKKNYELRIMNYELFTLDATHISEKIAPDSIDCIVTEPYLGPSKISNLRNIILGLDKLYLGCFREWRKILKPGGVVVMAFPSFKSPAFAKASAGKEFFVKKAIDTCENLGYTLVGGPYSYHRPQAVVIRNIYILIKKQI